MPCMDNMLNGLFGMQSRQRPNHPCLQQAQPPIERSWMRQPSCQTDIGINQAKFRVSS